jgi:dihydroorotate dehydrogenase electron transfer subunit
VLVGGGIGVPPLLFLGSELRGRNIPVSLLVGARTASRHLPDDMLEGAAHEVATATDDGSGGHRGFVTDLLEFTLDEHGDCAVYTCGPGAMMAAVAAICRERAVTCQASLEEYMACGFGVCVGCVVEMAPGDGEVVSPYERYRRICVDGPVFDALRVRWE